MGPDSVTSSVAVTPHTPMRSESRDFVVVDKSASSSDSSESKTLTIRSPELPDPEIVKRPSVESPVGKSPVTLSTDSVMQLKSTEPPCSSTESFCSPSKLKSEPDFSSELHSPISANSIRFTANYNFKSDGGELLEPTTGNISCFLNNYVNFFYY